MFRIKLIQRCEPGCKSNNTVVAELENILGFGTLGEGGSLFVTDGDKRVCLVSTCPFCAQPVTYVTNIKTEG